MGVKAELLGLSRFSAERTVARLDGLTDDELLWEPVPHCWSIRLRDGVPVADWAPAAVTTGFTTVGWRLWHVTTNYAGARNASWLGLPHVPDADLVGGAAPPMTADDARDRLQRAVDWCHEVLEATTDELLAEPMGPIAGEYEGYTKASLLTHELDEVIHHGAEIGVVRDLYRWTTRPYEPTLAEAVRDGQRAIALALLQDPTVAVDARVDEPIKGATALHHACGSGDVALVRALLDRGADPTLRDEVFRADALGWATFFGRDDVAAVLAPA